MKSACLVENFSMYMHFSILEIKLTYSTDKKMWESVSFNNRGITNETKISQINCMCINEPETF